MTDHDVVIIGAGPAGLSASLYTSRAELDTLVIGNPHDSLLEKSEEIQNYLGVAPVSGPDILDGFVKHAERYGAEILDEEVVHAEETDDGFMVRTHKMNEFTTRALIICSGMTYKKSGIENEDDYVGRGIHYCVACDGPFYKDKKVAVVGSGNFAAEEALELTDITDDITLISRTGFEFSPEFEEALKKHNIRKKRMVVEAFGGDEKLEWLELDTGEKRKFDGVFIAVGTASSLAFANKLGLDYEGSFLRVSEGHRTGVEHVYAAGGCTGGNVQAIKSAGDGCDAAVSCIKDLKGLEAYNDYT